jgi:hypothetical protein
MAKAQKTAGRGSSLRYELIRDFSKLYNKNIPEYTDSDKERKLEIFNIPNSETSIVSGNQRLRVEGIIYTRFEDTTDILANMESNPSGTNYL